MAYYPNSLQADLPRFTNPDQEWQQAVANVVYSLAGVGGGGNIVGSNYRIVGGVFSLINLDTGLTNAPHAIGADGTQGISLDNGVA